MGELVCKVGYGISDKCLGYIEVNLGRVLPHIESKTDVPDRDKAVILSNMDETVVLSRAKEKFVQKTDPTGEFGGTAGFDFWIDEIYEG